MRMVADLGIAGRPPMKARVGQLPAQAGAGEIAAAGSKLLLS